MKRTLIRLTLVAAIGLMIAGCSQAAPAPTAAPAKPAAAPTTAPAAPAPTKAAAAPAQPTAAPAAPARIDWPTKGKTVTIIVPYGAGGAGDLGARLLAPELSKELGANFEVVNKAGAGSQTGITEMARSKPDGYTLGFTHLPAAITIYLDPERQAAFGRKDLQPVALYVFEANAIAVRGDSPYKSMKDLVDAAKANPGKVRVTDSGILSDGHIADLLLQEATGARFAIVHTEGGTQAYTEVLGGNADACNISLGANSVELVKSGQLRMLGIYDKQGDPRFPGVATAESQGYKVYSSTSRALSAPTGVPKEIVQLVAGSMKKIMDTADFKEKAAKMGLNLVYMNTAELETYWDGMEASVKPLISLAKK